MVTWEKVELGKNADIFRGGSPRPIQAYLTQSNNGINWIKIGDVASNAKYISTTEERIIPEGAPYSRAVSKGDFILSNSMSFGRPYILKTDGCIHDGWLTIQNYQKNFDTDFLYYVLGSEETNQQYVSMAAGSSVQNLNKEKVSRVIVAKPPLPEQRRIAEALSDTDALLSVIEKLIDKKRAIKQSTMQELLTGKRRLPGFKGEWASEQLGTICTLITDGSHESPLENNNGYYMPSVKDMTENGFDFSKCKKISQIDYDRLIRNGCQPQINDVLIAKDGSILKFSFAVKNEMPVVILSSIAILRPNAKKMNSEYLAHYFRQASFIEYTILNYKTGTGVPRIVLKNFKEIFIGFPQSIAEQTAIAEILSDMDAEIEALTAKLDKLRNIKQGVMSELLTGHIRLIEEKSFAETVVSPKIMESSKTNAETEPAKVIPIAAHKSGGHNQQFDDAVMIAGIVNALYSEKFLLGRKKVQKCLYLLRRYQDESTSAFKKKAAGPYADEVRYKGGEPIALSSHYVATTTVKDKGTTFARGKNISQALGYIQSWGKQDDIKWVTDKLKYKKVDELELLATVDMAICDLEETGTAVSVAAIKHLIETNEDWKAKLKKQSFSDANIARAIRELQTLL